MFAKNKKHDAETRTESGVARRLSGPEHRRSGRSILPWLLFLMPVIVYLPSLRHQFVYDDRELILDESRPERWTDFANVFRERHFSTVPYYRPVLRLGFRFQKLLHGDTAWPYHLVNALLAGAAALAAFRLLSQSAFGIQRYAAGIAALGWALHPAMSSCVYPICSGRETLLPSVLMLLCVDAWIRSGRGWGVAALGWFILALFSREQAVALPAILVLCDLLDFSGEARFRHFRRFAWRYAVTTAAVGIYLILRWWLFEGSELAFNFANLELPLYSYLYALQTTFFPFMDLVYEPPVAVWWSPWRALGALTLTVALLAACQRVGAGRSVLFWGAWFLIIQAPTANFLKQEALFDERYMMLAGLALFALAATLYCAAKSINLPMRRALPIGVATVMLGWTLVSLHRGRFFRDDITFTKQWLRTNPNAVNALVNYSKYRIDQQAYRRALRVSARAVALAPDLAGAHYNFGLANHYLGDLDTAMTAYRRTLEIDPEHAAHYNLALALDDTGKHDLAILHYRKALQDDPENFDAHYNLALRLVEAGQLETARQHFERAAALDARDIRARYNLGVVLEKLERWDAAETVYREVLERNPMHISTLFNLGANMYRRQRFERATQYFERILVLEPDNQRALQNLRHARDAATERAAEP